MTSPTTEPVSAKREERRFVLRLLVLFVLAVAAFLLVLAFRGHDSSAQFPRVKLADGTWLVARAVTVGTSHSIEIPYPLSVQVQIGRFQRSYRETRTTPTDRMMVWLTRENERGEMLDMDWFGRCDLILAETVAVSPMHYHRQSNQANTGSGSGTGSSGFSDAKPFGAPATRMHLALIRIDLPLVRPRDGTMRLDVYDGAKQVVAQLAVPYPALPNMSLEDWQPEPLPATRTVGNLTVTLTGIKTYTYPDQRGISLSPQLTFVHDGQESNTWAVMRQETRDLLGNVNSAWNSDLSPLETAWKLRLTMYQTAAGRFLPEETKKLPQRPLTAATKLSLVAETHTVNRTDISLVGLGGTGPIEFTLPNSSSQFKTATYQPGQSASGMSNSCTGNKCVVEFASGHPFLVTSNVMSDSETNLQLVIRDQSGEILSDRGSSSIDGLTFWFFEPKPTSTAIEIEIIAQQNRHAEFLIAPPKPDVIQTNQ